MVSGADTCCLLSSWNPRPSSSNTKDRRWLPDSARGPTMAGVALDVKHRLVPVPGGRIHLVEQGSGPLVLLVHGFPESWYSWLHQLPALAAAGYRAVAIDVRGYGRSSKPADVAAYRMLGHVAGQVGGGQAPR